MPVEVILPRVDMDMAVGRISKWLAGEGSRVTKGQPLFEIETDKAAMEIEAPADGTLAHIRVPEGGEAPVGATVAYIYGEGEAAVPPPSAPAVPPVDGGRLAPAPTAADQDLIPLADKPRATPLARRLAKAANLDLRRIVGSGPRGRILAADLRQAPASDWEAPAPPPKPEPAAASTYESGTFTVRPLNGMRRTIAARLTQSKQTVPHFYLTITCTIDRLLAARESLNRSAPRNADGTPAFKLTINDFMVKALGLALRTVPAANVTWAGDSILEHQASDIGVAVAVPGGLFTPVVRGVEAKPLAVISREIREMAEKARAGRLQPADYRGGTSAVSNLGMYGIEEFTAIINPPQATILAVGAGVERYVPAGGKPVLVTQMTCTLSCDHRAVDGAVAAELLAQLRANIEDPVLMLA
jgi:pyruvate dehydrogenase E2 component (dihydrolipoamide acetyltransferase)